VVFGNDFGNKAVVLPQTLVIPIDLAEEAAPKLMNVSQWPFSATQPQPSTRSERQQATP
jgi:hypothetical protein